MVKGVRFGLQALNYSVFMFVVWYFSLAPSVRHLADDQAMVTLAFGHHGQPREPCRKLSADELLKLPPNMRRPSECPRARSPILVEARMDGQQLFKEIIHPPGLYEDGSVDIFLSKKIPAGRHFFEVAMNDSVRVKGYTHTGKQEVTVAPAQRLVIDFSPEKGFAFH